MLPPARFDPFCEALLAERVERVPLLVAAVLVPEDFLVPELLRGVDFVDDFVAVDRFALLFAAFPAILTATST